MSSVASAVGNGVGMWRGPADAATVRGMGAGVVVGGLLSPRRVRRHVVTPPRRSTANPSGNASARACSAVSRRCS